MSYSIAPEAVEDLDQIWFYIAGASGSEVVADRLIDALLAEFLLIARHPLMGRQRNDLRLGYRSFPLGEYVIYYHVLTEGVEILRCLHGRRDILALFE